MPGRILPHHNTLAALTNEAKTMEGPVPSGREGRLAPGAVGGVALRQTVALAG